MIRSHTADIIERTCADGNDALYARADGFQLFDLLGTRICKIIVDSLRELKAGGDKAFANTCGGSDGIFIGYEKQIILKAVSAENFACFCSYPRAYLYIFCIESMFLAAGAIFKGFEHSG